MKKILPFLLLVTICTITYSQTKTFNYLSTSNGSSTYGFSASDCNIFSPNAVSIDGVNHSSYAGGVTYNSTYGIILPITPKASPPGSTAFVINYNFTPGNNYNIAITAIGSPSILLKTSIVPNFNQFNTNTTSACVTDNNAFSYNTAGIAQFSSQTATTSQTYTIPQFGVLGNTIQPYLIVWASGGNLDLDGLSISKIVITQTPIVSFSLVSSISNINCGAPTSVSFTVNNNGTTPATNYSWNFGATPNGWLYNGSPAPQTISTGTTKTLSLTTACTNTRNNITASVTANGTFYNTNSSAITTSPPILSISGSQVVCTPSPYTIENLPCDATVSWSLNNNTANLSATTGSSVNLSYVTGGTNILTAVVNSTSCGNTTVNKTLTIGGTQQSGIIYVNASNNVTTWGTWNIVQYGSNSTPIVVTMSRYSTWSGFSGPVQYWWTSTNYADNTHSLYLIPDNYPFLSQYITATVSSYNECGQYTSNITYFQNYTAVNHRANYEIGPNPTKGEFTVSIQNSDKDFQKQENKFSVEARIWQLEVINLSGRIIKKISSASVQQKVNISGNPPGVYILRIFDGNKWNTEKLILQ